MCANRESYVCISGLEDWRRCSDIVAKTKKTNRLHKSRTLLTCSCRCVHDHVLVPAAPTSRLCRSDDDVDLKPGMSKTRTEKPWHTRSCSFHYSHPSGLPNPILLRSIGSGVIEKKNSDRHEMPGLVFLARKELRFVNENWGSIGRITLAEVEDCIGLHVTNANVTDISSFETLRKG